MHEQFRLDWRSATEPPGFHRAIFVASRSRLESALLIEDVPEIQYHALSNLGALAARAGTTVVKTVFGPIVSFENDLITAQLETFGAHTRNELAMLLRCVEPGDLILDIGAHVGTYTLPLAAAAGMTGCVIAVEQSEETFAVLEANVGSRDLRNVTLVCGAVGDIEAGYVRTSVAGNSGANFLTQAGAGVGLVAQSLDLIRAMAD